MPHPVGPSSRKTKAVVATHSVRAYSVDGGARALFSFSFDVVERLLKARDGRKAKLNYLSWARLHMRFMTFSHYNMPALFVCLDRYLFPSDVSEHPKMFKRGKDTYTFGVYMKTKAIGLKPTFKSQRLKLLWVDKPAGLMLIFEDGDMHLPRYDGDENDEAPGA